MEDNDRGQESTARKVAKKIANDRPSGPFLERPGKLLEPVSHPVSPRKLYGCFSKLPLFSIPLICPVTCPVIYGRSRPTVKLPGSRKCRKTKQNGGRRRTFFVFREDHSHIKDAPFLSIWLSPRSLNDFGSLLRKNRVVRQGNKGGIGKKHAERVDTAHWLRSETQLNSCCFIFFLQLEGICMEALYKCDVLFYCFQNQQTAEKIMNT